MDTAPRQPRSGCGDGIAFPCHSSHLTKLDGTSYLAVEKAFVGKVPRTLLQLAQKGREALRAYRDRLVDVLSQLPE